MRWTRDEEMFLKSNIGQPASWIAGELGRSLNSVDKKRRKMFGKLRIESICSVCGEVYIKSSPMGTYCSAKCRSLISVDRATKYQLTPKGRYNTYKQSARVRGYTFDLLLDVFMEFWQEPCAYCGEPIDTIGLDRVDNSKGYTSDNIVPCCTVCNKMKMCMSSDEFLTHIKKILINSRG